MKRTRPIPPVAAWPVLLATVWTAVVPVWASEPPSANRAAEAGPLPVPEPPPVVVVRVVEVAGTQAFVQPGATGGVHRGAAVTVHGHTFAIADATGSYAVIDLGDARLQEGDLGRASVVVDAAATAREVPAPRPLAQWVGAWGPVEGPALSQAPRFVPLGNATADGRYAVRLTAAVGASLPLDQHSTGMAETELNARVHAEPFRAARAAFDLDVSLLNWIAPNAGALPGSEARQLLRVRELSASYRTATGYGGAVGRLPYASSTLGTLDGLRVTAPLGNGLSIGAFGGLLPDPLSGAPSLDAERFGAEVRYSNPALRMRPEAALVVNGSVFRGRFDERRLAAVVGLYPGPARFGARVEVQSFAPGNPWGAKAVELTGAGLDASVRRGVLEVSGRLDVRQPERSLWLASYLPISWLCRAVPKSPGATTGPDVCDGSVSTRTFGDVDVSLHFDRLSLLVGGTTTFDLTQSDGAPATFGGFAVARVMRIARLFRLDASGSYSRSTYLDMYGGSAGPGVTLFGDALDVSAYYRAAVLQYRADTGALIQNGVGGTAMFFPNAPVVFTIQGEAITGNDTQALVLFGTVTWRPRP